MRSNVNYLKFAAPEKTEDAPPGLTPREPRTRTLLVGTVSNVDNSASATCVINNISAGGVRITISESIPLGQEFKLHVPQRNLFRTVRQVWRKGDQLGVAFQSEAASTPEEGESWKDRKIRALEAEVAALRAEIGGLKHQLYQRDDVKER